MALQATRKYKAQLEASQKVVELPKVEEIAVTESPEYKTQKKAFEAFLIEEYNMKPRNPFLVSMHDRHMRGEILSPRMVAAIEKCMEQRKTEALENADKKPRIVTIAIPQFIMQNLGIESRIVTGEIINETEKAWYIKGHADIVENLSWCVRCGKELKEPASQVTGMGATCAKKMGIPYDAKGVLSMTKRQRTAIRKKFQKHLKNQTFMEWLPKSRCSIVEGE